jgi:hypothetical protein
MKEVLGDKSCKWISVTNADNVYGSDVIHEVLRSSFVSIEEKRPDLIIAPLDSRNLIHGGLALVPYLYSPLSPL